MKKLIGVGLVNAALLAVILGVLLDKEVLVHAGGGGGTPVGNGDVNADGTIDISDGIYLLANLFTGGPPPVAIGSLPCDSCCPPQVVKGLPSTGQTKCYGYVDGQGWVEVPCGEAACQGQDGQYAAGCPGEDRFADNGDGTVTDTCTGLMWQKGTADVNGSGAIEPRDGLAWCDALAYCEGLSFAGHDDWRLPNVRELQSIVDYVRSNPSIDPVFEALSDWYWSSTSIAVYPDNAWSVNFYGGYVGVFDDKDSPSFVRAVRLGT